MYRQVLVHGPYYFGWEPVRNWCKYVGATGINNQIDQNVTVPIDSNVTKVIRRLPHSVFETNGDLFAMGKNEGALEMAVQVLKTCNHKQQCSEYCSCGSHSMYELSQSYGLLQMVQAN